MNKIACITGATSGIGKATAVQFAANGWNLIITGRRAERLQGLKSELEKTHQINVHTLCFDVRQKPEVDHAFQSLSEGWGNIDVLVNNAGLALGTEPLQEALFDDWENMIDTNVKGLLYVSRAVIPRMIERNQGMIVNLGSIAGKETYKNGNVYCASKHAVDSLTKAMRIDLLPHKIRVGSVCPGAVETEFSVVRYHGDQNKADAVYQGFEPLLAEDIADVIWFMASRPPHVNINDVLVMPTAQANSSHLLRE